MIRIEKGIAIPHKRSALQKYPFGDMQPGDSIVGPPSIRTCACGWRKRHPGFTYIARAEGPKKVRLWCVTQASLATQAQAKAGIQAMRDAADAAQEAPEAAALRRTEQLRPPISMGGMGGTNATHDADVPAGEAA